MHFVDTFIIGIDKVLFFLGNIVLLLYVIVKTLHILISNPYSCCMFGKIKVKLRSKRKI